MKKPLLLALALVLVSPVLFAQGAWTPNGNRIYINGSVDHALSIVAGYRLSIVPQGATTIANAIKTYDLGKPATFAVNDLRFQVVDATASTVPANANTIKLADTFCGGVLPAGKYGLIVTVVLSTGGTVVGPPSARGIECGTAAAASIWDVQRAQ